MPGNIKMVSVCMITYNHEQFIKQAIDSVLEQKTTFDFELIIGEDFSTDNTRMICEGYASKNPETVVLLPSDKNHGAVPNLARTITACHGKYIAICEADDFWCDPEKLQKQVNFMESNTSYSVCFHQAKIIFDDVKGKERMFCVDSVKETTNIKDILSGWYIPTCSILFKRNLFEIPEWFKYVHNGDYSLLLLLSDKGEIGYLRQTMSVYRKHSNSFSYTLSSKYIWEQKIKILHYFDVHTNFKYHDLITKREEKFYSDYQNILKTPHRYIEKIFSIKWISIKMKKLYFDIFHISKKL